jgi:hypothetical protein
LETDLYEVPAAWHKDDRNSFEAVDVLHQGGFVHGDLLDANTMVARDCWDDEKDPRNVQLVDFDWAGRKGEKEYPSNVNYWEITRPIDARDGMPIKRGYDLEMTSRKGKVHLPICILPI